MDEGEIDPADDVSAFGSVNGWTVVLWPEYFNIHDVAAVADMSGRLGVLASTVHTYDGDYWAHRLFRSGVELDRFASVPGYFAEDPNELLALEQRWAGNAMVVAEAVGCPVGQVAPYLVHVPAGADGRAGKAFADDEFPIDDMWVFVDFWRRLGITRRRDSPIRRPAARRSPGLPSAPLCRSHLRSSTPRSRH